MMELQKKKDSQVTVKAVEVQACKAIAIAARLES
jgi:hypothetical protein